MTHIQRKSGGASVKSVIEEQRFVPTAYGEEARLEEEARLAKAMQLEDSYVRMLIKGAKFQKVGHGFFLGGSVHWKFVYCDLVCFQATRE